MLVDSGIAKVYDPGSKTTLGARGVSPGFSPQEQYGQGRTDARTDVYALGATLFAVLTGQGPVESIQRSLGTLLIAPRLLNLGITPNTERAILRAMEMVPDQRYQSIAEFRLALEVAPTVQIAGQPLASASIASGSTTVPSLGGLRLPLWAIGAVVTVCSVMLALGGWVGYLVSQTNMSQTPIVSVSPTGLVALTQIRLPTEMIADTSTRSTPATSLPTEIRASPSPTPSSPVTSAWQQGKIAFVTNQTGHDRLYVLDLNVETDAQLLPEPAGATRNLGPSWSSDGTQLAFYSRINNRSQIVVLSSPLRGQPRVVGADLQTDFISSPTWDPTGKRIIAFGTKSGETYFFVINAFSGSGEGQLSPGMDTARLPAWSPNDDEIAFAVVDKDGNGDIYVMSLGGGSPIKLTQNSSSENYAPTWSPDGRWIAYQSDLGRGGHQSEIWIMDREGKNARQVTASSAGTWSRAPSWSPDGQWIVFVSNQAGSIGPDYGELFVVSVSTGETVQLTHTGGQVYDWRPAWGP